MARTKEKSLINDILIIIKRYLMPILVIKIFINNKKHNAIWVISKKIFLIIYYSVCCMAELFPSMFLIYYLWDI